MQTAVCTAGSKSASQFGQRRASITSILSMQNGKGSPHFGQTEGILQFGRLGIFGACRLLGRDAAGDGARGLAETALTAVRNSLLDVLDVLNLFP